MDAPAPDAVLYDDPDIQVLWHAGDASRSGFALVTFGDMDRLADGQRFFADTPVQKAGLPCIGVMPKAPNWFPPDSMAAASEVILAVIGQYRQRILYGGSMGGYAAIKYSRLLGASHVIALCPQWSIDPDECNGMADERQKWFVPAMRGMGVEVDDMAGAVFVFADLGDAQDRWHVMRLVEHCPDLDVINVPSVAHHVTSVFAGTQNLQELLDACRARALPRLRHLVRDWRRDNRLRRQVLVERASPRHAGFIFPAIVRAALHNQDWAIQEWHHLFLAAAWLRSRGEEMAARTLLHGAAPLVVNPRRQLRVCIQLGALDGSHVGVRTHHGTFLAYDVARDRCVHAASPDGRGLLLLRVEVEHLGMGLFVTPAGTRLVMTAGRTGLLRVSPERAPPRERSRLEIRATGSGWFTLALDGAFLSAEPGGNLFCNRQVADRWEHFRFDNCATV